ncbi:hypothetical protein HBH56_205350 [Parastagonospora nodorum]|uniref:Uncharacterized protein n=1 Tax=Phaeosphaeria nodorum (strain SN15 / ATCC MYA-4574 / FGSC 10173) TaxID=321614 RepID=A0A7U2EX78_PHANO|nr:hypothetical protein HBH56_205350 [Parastagonospora nodorum]QRC94781.1 hypothetical protein JI435_149280 [Parastagonospora nodorum SN15]KAH3923802.1 hypothetical protein HBH54_204220 [Parastagonospora nodorum]KAH3962384.1 hypothetical protein HBH51_175510 [Parastagonospora nodorum]KAH3967199.1 hypothetical protein HBH52_192910 [Parastagonospora nodorum]
MADETKYRLLGEQDESNTEKVPLEVHQDLIKRLRRSRMLSLALAALCMILAVLEIFNFKPEVLYPQLASEPLLGEDPTGFVPKGGPVKYTDIPEKDPYRISLDTFDSLDAVKAMVDRLRVISNCECTWIFRR